MRHRAWGTGTVLGYEDDRMTVLFDTVGYKTLSVALVHKEKLLADRGLNRSGRRRTASAIRLIVRMAAGAVP